MQTIFHSLDANIQCYCHLKCELKFCQMMLHKLTLQPPPTPALSTLALSPQTHNFSSLSTLTAASFTYAPVSRIDEGKVQLLFPAHLMEIACNEKVKDVDEQIKQEDAEGRH